MIALPGSAKIASIIQRVDIVKSVSGDSTQESTKMAIVLGDVLLVPVIPTVLIRINAMKMASANVIWMEVVTAMIALKEEIVISVSRNIMLKGFEINIFYFSVDIKIS